VKMWSGRLREPLDAAFEQWQRSFGFDWRLLPYEVAASKAFAAMLRECGVLTQEETARIRSALDDVLRDFGEDAARTEASKADAQAEDIHHFVELKLVERVGELGHKLHAGRSRNEQIATDLRLYARERIAEMQASLDAWISSLLDRAEAAGDAAMPAYTHLQRAEPVPVAHWLLSYVAMLERDRSRLGDCAARMDECPLGSGAVAGATLRLDRAIAARELGFSRITANSMDATSDRDFVLELVQALTLLGLHVSRFAEEVILFSTAEFGFLDLPEAFATGSSAMPQKKNPDLAELARGQAGRIGGAAQGLALALKGLPLAYNKDLQDTQLALYQVVETMAPLLPLLARFTAALTFRTERMEGAARSGFLNAMAAATYLARKGVPFRRAHGIVGQAVRLAMEQGCELDGLGLEQLRELAPQFDADFYGAIGLEATIDCHDVPGGANRQRVREALEAARRRHPAREATHAGA
jgi:argininosuccinate lyase